MKHTARRLRFILPAALLTAALLLPALSAFAVPAGSVTAPPPGTVVVNGWDPALEGAKSLFNVEKGMTYTVRVHPNAPFSGISICTPTWGTNDKSMRVSLYRFDTDMKTTFAAAPAASELWETIPDNNVGWLTFPTQPAGEYVIRLGDTNGTVAVWTFPATVMRAAVSDGKTESAVDPQIAFAFDEKPETPFLPVTEETPEITDTSAALHTDAPAGCTLKDTFDIAYYDQKGVLQVNPGEVCGMRLHVNAPFRGMSFCTPTWGTTDSSAVYALYKWEGNWQATVAAGPLHTQKLTDMTDGAICWLTFPEQPAGEYLFALQDVTGPVGLWVYPKTISKGWFMENGAEIEGEARMTIAFTSASDAYFTECTSIRDVDGTHTTPEQWVMPADSAVYTHEVMPDTWVFTDALGRTSLTYEDVGGPREDKTIAMFFWTWFDRLNNLTPVNMTELMKVHPEIKNDYYSPLWDPNGAFFWNESIYGYYRTSDSWVLRKQAELLADALVDTIVTDNTNGGADLTFRSGYRSLYEAWDKAQKDGVNVPKISYMFSFSPCADATAQMTSIYTDVYRTDEYPNLWFWWDGKPLWIAHTSQLNDHVNTEKEIRNFFTFRTPQPYYSIPKRTPAATWGWLSIYPQAVYYATNDDLRAKKPEMTTVGVSANWDYEKGELSCMNGWNIMGRSYTSTGYHTEEGAVRYGYFFAEQFDYALGVDPRLIFITGWNEGFAGRSNTFSVPNGIADEFTDEYSRDIEPSKGELKDNYYYQLVNYVRRYKGVRPIPAPTAAKTVDLGGSVSQWEDVGPYYAAYIGNTGDRDSDGYGSVHYSETSGRNDIAGAKVSRDADNLYVLIECAEDVTSPDALWMNLYLDTDLSAQGWETFDYVVNRAAPGVVERFTGNGYETEKVGEVTYTVSGKYLQIRIPKAMLGLSGWDFTVNFAVTDNVHDADDTSVFSGDIMDFYVSGDAAPGGRFKFSYVSTAENAGAVTGTEADTTPETAPGTTPDTDPGAGTQPGDAGCKSALDAACLPLLLPVPASVHTLLRRRKRNRKSKNVK